MGQLGGSLEETAQVGAMVAEGRDSFSLDVFWRV